MTDIQPRHYVIGIIMFAFFISGGVALYQNIWELDSTVPGSSELTSFNETFNKQAEVEQSVTDIKSKIITQSLPQPLEFIATLFLTAFQALMSLFTSLSFMEEVFTGLSSFFGIPIWATITLTSLISMIIVFSIVSAILQRDI